MLISAGSLKHRIRIERATETNTGGHVSKSWSNLVCTFASIKKISGGEGTVVNQQQAKGTYEIKIRHYPVKETDRITYDGRTFNISDVDNVDEANVWTVITAIEVK